MHIILAIVLVLALIYFAAMIIWAIVFAIFVVPVYIIFLLYNILCSFTMNLFIALDKLFYPGFDVFPVVMWAFWGAVVGVAVQGRREMKRYGRKGLGALIGISPLLLMWLVKFIQ